MTASLPARILVPVCRTGFWFAASVVVLTACRSNNTRSSAPAHPSADPCRDTPAGDICSEDLPVANPVTLPDGRVRAVFEDETDLNDAGTRCRVVDFAPTGVETVATGCCKRGHVVAAALDESDRFYVACKEPTAVLGGSRLIARRLDADRTFHSSTPPVSLVPADFGPDAGLESIQRHHLLVANGAMWVVQDLGMSTTGKDWLVQSYVQSFRDGAKLIEIGGQFAGAYVSDQQVFAITVFDGESEHRFYRLAEDHATPVVQPAGISDARCEAWHGTAVDGAGPLALHLMQYDEATQSDRPITLRLPYGRALPSATHRGSGPALCNGPWSRFDFPLAIGAHTLAAHAVTDSEALSCTASGCVLVYVSQNELGGETRFHVHRFSPGRT